MRDKKIWYRKKKKDELTHSSSYERYFEGVLEYRKKGEKHAKICRMYVGNYYMHPGNCAVKLKLFYVLSYIIIFICFILASMQDFECNRTWYIALSYFGSIFGLFMLFVGIVFYTFCPRKMTVYQYRTGTVKVKRWSIITAGFLALSSLTTFINLLFNKSDNKWFVLLFAVCYAALSFLAYLIYRKESRLQYIKQKNDVKLPDEDEFEIYKVTGIDLDKLLNHELVEDE